MEEIKRTKVFISYSQEDAGCLERLQVHFKPLERDGLIDCFDDTRLAPGLHWHDEVTRALDEAAIAIFLVSSNFLAADFINDVALPGILKRAAAGGVHIMPVIVGPCLFDLSPLAAFKPVNSLRSAHHGLTEAQLETVLLHTARAVLKAIRKGTNELAAASETDQRKQIEQAEPNRAAKHLDESVEDPVDRLDLSDDAAKRPVGSTNLRVVTPRQRRANGRRTSGLAISVTVIGLALLPVAAFGASLTSSNYQKLFISIGAMGGLYLVFGLFFANITMFPERHRAKVLGLLVGAFVLVTLILGARAAGYYYKAQKELIELTEGPDACIPTITEFFDADVIDKTLADLSEGSVLVEVSKNISVSKNVPSKERIAQIRECPEPTKAEVYAERMRRLTSLQEHRPSGPDSIPLIAIGKLTPSDVISSQIPNPTDAAVRERAEAIPSNEEIVAYLKAARCGAPIVSVGTAEARGSLDKEVVRRIINRHLNEVGFCYEREGSQITATGTVIIQFTIGGNGTVTESYVNNSTLSNPNIEQCIASAVRRWEFPRPQGGTARISYSFDLPLGINREKAEKHEGMKAVAKIINKHRAQLNWCLNLTKRSDSSFELGIIKLHFFISKNGAVSNAKIDELSPDKTELSSCMVKYILQWQFPKLSADSTEVIYPVKLN